MVAAADLDARSSNLKSRRGSSGLPFNVNNIMKYSIKGRLSPESTSPHSKASKVATPKILERQLRTSMTMTINKLEKNSRSPKNTPLGQHSLEPLNVNSGQVAPKRNVSPSTQLYTTIEKQYGKPKFQDHDYRTFIFDENEKMDYDTKKKQKKEKLLTDPFLRNFLAQEGDKKKKTEDLKSWTKSG